MNMALKYIFDIQVICCAIFHHSPIVRIPCPSRGGIVVENGIENDGFGRGWVTDDVGHGGSPRMEESVNSWFDDGEDTAMMHHDDCAS